MPSVLQTRKCVKAQGEGADTIIPRRSVQWVLSPESPRVPTLRLSMVATWVTCAGPTCFLQNEDKTVKWMPHPQPGAVRREVRRNAGSRKEPTAGGSEKRVIAHTFPGAFCVASVTWQPDAVRYDMVPGSAFVQEKRDDAGHRDGPASDLSTPIFPGLFLFIYESRWRSTLTSFPEIVLGSLREGGLFLTSKQILTCLKVS